MNQKLTINQDNRGRLVEIFKIPNIGQVFYATTVPGAIRGDHYHIRKIESFCVIEGTGKISMRNRESGEAREYIVSGEKPEIAVMPKNWTHNIKNIGDTEMKLLAWTDEVFNPADPDTYPETV
ncbi:MAG: NAD-dependent epimerase/dehydratase [Candidatus Nomurabacteria bacterium GW2011_GWB1_47_6]|uniref:NAD-dependent epimerase/dehydratase n=1 Tax=Candidatus Nomurabacteria bacterium GW2011_GWB1_47_6 TaxID=1618749 RepID=A0A0G1W0P5_9BACT|nr:MAG: NAD-dependent epimerase/dehydratase [Candidatus Nomurabacteria bacterium GW2011_GWB1_47_6]